MMTLSPDQTETTVGQTVESKFAKLFGGRPLVVNSPGRINLIGEHTDYNQGFVMPAAIDKGIRFAIGRRSDSTSVIHSIKYDQSLSIDQSNPEKILSPVWANYLLGILFKLKETGFNIPPFNCVFHGDLPTGAGMSSSAAMECGFIFALDQLFELKLARHDMITMAQWAEHHYADVKCGIMDQFASMMGRKDNVIVLDCRSMEYTYFPIHLRDHYLLLCDSGVKHSLASSEYNTRRNECGLGVEILHKKFSFIRSLRDVSAAMVEENKALLPEKVYKRCLYVTQENDRVLNAQENLRLGQLSSFGEKMFRTHEGLSGLYEVSCTELDFLVEHAKKYPGVLGARMMGGGFGGCTLNIIERKISDEFIQSASQAYQSAFGTTLATHIVSVADGTSIVHRDK